MECIAVRLCVRSLPRGIILSSLARCITANCSVRWRPIMDLCLSQAPSEPARFFAGITKQLVSIKGDTRLPGLDRLTRSTQRFTTRARRGPEPSKAIMKDEQLTFSPKANGSKLNNAHEQANAASSFHKELPSLSDQAKERQAAVPSSSQPSSARGRTTHADASRGVPVFVMLPLDTVSFSQQTSLQCSSSLVCGSFKPFFRGALASLPWVAALTTGA